MGAVPLVSIVTPSFNQGRFIGQTIDSVLGQDYPRVDYLIVDGGSADNTLEILRGHRDRVRWISELDSGQSAAINRGWRMTDGEIIAWLNSDDTLLPGAVARVADYMEGHPDVDAVYGDCDYVDSAGKTLQPYPTRPFSLADLLCSPYNFIPQPATFVRRRVLENVGYLDESLHYVMDLDLWLRIGVGHMIAYLPGRLATLRLHGGAKSVWSAGRFGPEMVHIYERLLAMPDLPPAVRSVKGKALSMAYYRAAHYYFASGQLSDARRHALAGWRHSPLNLRRVLIKTLVLGSMGKSGLCIARRLSRDPLRG